MSETKSIEVNPRSGDIWRQLLYIYHLTDHRIRQQTRGYTLGFIWWIIDPLVNTGILYIVTTMVIASRTSSLAMFLLSGLMMYRFLQTAINGACGSLNQAMILSSRLYVPKYIFVVRDVAGELAQFLIGVAFIIVMVLLLGNAHIKPLQLLYVLVVATTFALASASVVALVSLVFRDLRVILGYIFRALFFLSGTFFGLDRVPEEWRTAFLSNPFALLMHEFRISLMMPRSLDFGMLTILFAASLALGAVGFGLLWKFDRILPKYAR